MSGPRLGELGREAGHGQLLVGGDDGHGGAGLGGGDEAVVLAAGVVDLLVQLDAVEVGEPRADPGAQHGAVLADAGGEGDAVDAVHGGGVGADVLQHAVAQHLHGQAGALAGLGLPLGLDLAAVAADAGNAQQAGLLVEDGVHALGVEALLLHDGDQDAGIHVAAAGAHDDAFQRGQAHAGVHALAPVHGRDGGAVAQVAGHDLQPLDGLAQQGGRAVGHVAVAGAVEAVAAQAELLAEVVGQAVGEGVVGHAVVEGGVEHGDVGHLGEHLAGGLDAHGVGRVVQGGVEGQLLDLLQDGVVDHDGIAEVRAAVGHAVADGRDVLALEHGLVELVHDGGQGLFVILHVQLEAALLALDGPADEALGQADALGDAVGEGVLGRHVDHVELEGAGTRVQGQDDHGSLLGSCVRWPRAGCLLLERSLAARPVRRPIHGTCQTGRAGGAAPPLLATAPVQFTGKAPDCSKILA